MGLSNKSEYADKNIKSAKDESDDKYHTEFEANNYIVAGFLGAGFITGCLAVGFPVGRAIDWNITLLLAIFRIFCR